jgi:chromosome segregation ATPase
MSRRASAPEMTSDNEEDVENRHGQEEEVSERGAKRLRSCSEVDGDGQNMNEVRPSGSMLYKPGSVVRVEVKNFMTYSHCMIEPGPTLNLVLGPNGTGKSSLVCALCVGLAGSTKLLGRADDVGSYIRRGTSEGEVLVTLAKEGGGTIVIRRKLRRAGGGNQSGRGTAQSDFFINGKPSSATKVKDLVKKYNIQLDNLCQFLPQDKVNEFARMKPVELLKATEMAIGEGELHSLHQSLIDEKKQLDEKSKIVEIASQAVDRHRGELQDLERSLGPIREKKRLEEEIELLEKHRSWQVYAEEVEKGKEDKDVLSKTKKTLARLDKEIEKLQNGPVKEKTAERKRSEKSFKDAVNQVAKNNIEPLCTEMENALTSADKMQNKIGTLESNSKKHKQRIEQTEHDIKNLKEVIQSMSTADHEKVRQEIELIDRQFKDLGNQELALNSSRRDLDDNLEYLKGEEKRFLYQLNQFTDKKRRVLTALDQRHPGTWKAFDYVQKNKSRFRGQVLGPLAMEIDIQKPYYADILEQQLPGNWLLYYIVQYEQDLALLKSELEAMDVCPYITVVEGDPEAPLKQMSGRSASYASHGVVASLDETFQSHPLIKHALDSHFNISSIFVMGEGQDDWESVFKANPRLEQIYTSKFQVRKRVSRYDPNGVTISVNDLKKAHVLYSDGRGQTSNQIDSLKVSLERVKQKIEDVQRQIMDLKPDMDRVQSHKKDLIKEKSQLTSNIQQAEQKLKNEKSKLRSKMVQLQAMKSKPDPLVERESLVKDLRISMKKALQRASKISSAAEACSKGLFKAAVHDLSAKELSAQIKFLSKETRVKSEQRDEMATMAEQLLASIEKHDEKVEKMKTEASALTGWPIPDDLKMEFELLPKLAADTLDLIEEKKSRHDSIIIMDPGAQRRYERIVEVLHNNEEKLEEYKQDHETLLKKVSDLKESWLPEIRRLVSQINANFSEAFQHVGIAGEVIFNETEGEDYSKYSIDLRVKFREEGHLMTLDSAYHSGGESSTSTILYLMALQGVTTAPFRVVDEINQGMDSVNERSVFKLLADAATAPDTPQCFLLTPKLLPDLPFSEEVTVLQIMNGVYIGDVAHGYQKDCILGTQRSSQTLIQAN